MSEEQPQDLDPHESRRLAEQIFQMNEDWPIKLTGLSEEEAMVHLMPNVLYERVFIIGIDVDHIEKLWNLIRDIKGQVYASMVGPMPVKDISAWGRGIWSDRFFFAPSVLHALDTLSEADQQFIRAITSTETLTKTLDLVKDKEPTSKSSSPLLVLYIVFCLSMVSLLAVLVWWMS